MYNHTATGYTKLEMYKTIMYNHTTTVCTKLEIYKIGNVQPHCTSGCTKLEMYKIGDVQTGDVQKLEMYNHSAIRCTNYTEPDVKKKFGETYQHWIQF